MVLYAINSQNLGAEQFPEAYLVNAGHLVENFDCCLQERLLSAAFAYAEVADSRRMLRNQDVNSTTVLDMPFLKPTG